MNTLVLNYAGMVVYQLVTIVQLTTTCLKWYFELVAGERVFWGDSGVIIASEEAGVRTVAELLFKVKSGNKIDVT